MLAIAGPSVNDIGIWFGIVVAGVSAYLVLKARKGTTDDDEGVRTAALLANQVTALTSAVQLLESDKRNLQTEISHLHELRAGDVDKAEQQALEIKRLTEMVTQQAAVEQFRSEALSWFGAIGSAVHAEPPQFPDHVPA